MEDTAATLRITKLNGTNYQTWKFKLELLLTKEDLWDTMPQDSPDPVTDEWHTKDRKARANIGLLLEDNQLHLVCKETTAKVCGHVYSDIMKSQHYQMKSVCFEEFAI